jgi:hypothetical protein
MFRNPQTDVLLLSNLNLNWKGPCPKKRRSNKLKIKINSYLFYLVPTPSPRRRATLEDDFMTYSSESEGTMMTLATNEEQQFIDDSTTIRIRGRTSTKRPFYFMHEKNIGWFLSLIFIFCFLTLLSAGGYNLWLIRAYHHFTWYVAFDTPIRLLARRSIRSSTRSDNKIATISELAHDIHQSDLQKEPTDASIENNDRSSPMSYYTYL